MITQTTYLRRILGTKSAILFFMVAFILSGNAKSRSFDFIIGGSSSTASARIAEQASTGYGGMAGVSIHPWPKMAKEISLRAIATFNTFGGNNSQLSDFEFFRAGLDIRLEVANPRQRPIYLLIGGGLARVSIDIPVRTNSGEILRRRNTLAYISPGIGMEIANSGSLRFFVEGRFTDIDGQSARDFQFWTLTAGISF